MSFWNFFRNIVASESPDEGLRQIDAILPDGFPVRILESEEGYHVSVWPFPLDPPPAVDAEDVAQEIWEQWWNG